jgi:hypothetical protein
MRFDSEKTSKQLSFYEFVIHYPYRSISELHFVEASKGKAGEPLVGVKNVYDFLRVMSAISTPSYGGMRFVEAVKVGMRLVTKYEKYV